METKVQDRIRDSIAQGQSCFDENVSKRSVCCFARLIYEKREEKKKRIIKSVFIGCLVVASLSIFSGNEVFDQTFVINSAVQ